MRHRKEAISTGANGADVLIYQDTNGVTPPRNVPSTSYSSIKVALRLDQDVTYLHKWGPTPDTVDDDLVIINGPLQAGEVAAASTFFERTTILFPGRNRISVTMGAPAPTASKIAFELNDYDGLTA
jgi:hypothetical protein